MQPWQQLLLEPEVAETGYAGAAHLVYKPSSSSSESMEKEPAVTRSSKQEGVGVELGVTRSSQQEGMGVKLG